MSEDSRMSRRRLLGVAGATGLAALSAGVEPAQAAPKYPAIRRAITAMAEATEELEEGRTIFGGHRVKALELLRAGIKECKDALAFAEKNAR